MRARLRFAVTVIAMLGTWLAADPQVPASHGSSKRYAIPSPEMRVDVNRASTDELLKIPGMTRVWAERIVRFRPYRAKNDLVDRGVISIEVYGRIKDYIVAHHEKHG